ncbi:MAG TPA: DUF3052 family protein [Candidatus Limnocylindrales bacterium]|nr:DUF3052 family protein [Candidatus Limnocylindrales bacterium]
MKTTAERLLIKPGARVRVVGDVGDAGDRLGPLPAGATLVDATTTRADAVVLFARNSGDVRAHLADAASAAGSDGLLWLAYPKGTSGLKTDLGRDTMTTLTDPIAGLTGVTLVSVDETWSAMRLRPSERYRA